MEISIDLLPPYSAHSISYRVINWARFAVSIPVFVDVGLNMDSHIDDNPKVCENLGGSNGFPRKLIVGVMESDVWSS